MHADVQIREPSPASLSRKMVPKIVRIAPQDSVVNKAPGLKNFRRKEQMNRLDAKMTKAMMFAFELMIRSSQVHDRRMEKVT